MSAESTVVYLGIKYDVANHETESIETRTDTRVVSARRHGLRTYLTGFDEGKSVSYLLVGEQVGVFGLENQGYLRITIQQIESAAKAVEEKVRLANLEGKVELHILWQPDY